MAETIIYEKQGHVVTITMNRPDALNAINRQLREELGDAIAKFDGDNEAFVGIILERDEHFVRGGT